MTTDAENERAFENAADVALHALERALDGIDGVEISLEMGILTLEFPDGVKYVINSHRAARQIWMAAELRAWHFDHQADGRWIAGKSGDELWATIEAVTSRKLGRAIKLARG